jgi:hypothetical protein
MPRGFSASKLILQKITQGVGRSVEEEVSAEALVAVEKK